MRYFEDHPDAKKVVIEKGKKLFGIIGTAPKEHDVDIAGVIRKEEEMYYEMLNRCEKLVKKKFNKDHLPSASDLTMMHHTYGCDPSVVEDILDVKFSQQIHDDYLVKYEQHRMTGRRGFVPVEIKVQNDH